MRKPGSHARQAGNALFLILLAIVMFVALNIAVTQSMRGDGKNATSEKTQLTQAVIDGYTTNIQNGALRLQMRGCPTVNYTIPSLQIAGDKSCFIFHPDGAGVIYQDLGLDDCGITGIDITTLAIGERCGSLVYAGTSGGNRIYALSADSGVIKGGSGTISISLLVRCTFSLPCGVCLSCLRG